MTDYQTRIIRCGQAIIIDKSVGDPEPSYGIAVFDNWSLAERNFNTGEDMSDYFVWLNEHEAKALAHSLLAMTE